VKRNSLITTASDDEKIISATDYQQFLVRLMRMVKGENDLETKKAVVNALIHRIQIHEKGFRINFYVGVGQMKKGEALASPFFIEK
jgi:hypothetical protein